MEDKHQTKEDLVQLARLALIGRPQDIQSFVYRIAKRYRADMPELSQLLSNLLKDGPTRSSVLRKEPDRPVPVDTDTRFHLMRVEQFPQLDHKLVLAPRVEASLTQIVAERKNIQALLDAGLEPTKTVLFTGPPGVGKTMAARWLARELDRPLIILDLASVMSSFLGRTGSNLKLVLDYAKTTDCVLLLDELDAIAKRRDDSGEIGELKRLVTVLLQEIDDWPANNLLIAATNHAELLDPAVWRRFEVIEQFPMPDRSAIEVLAHALMKQDVADADTWSSILSYSSSNQSFSDVERKINNWRRASVVDGKPFSEHLLKGLEIEKLNKQARIMLARRLVEGDILSQRKAQELTGIARETIRNSGERIKSARRKAL